jgi:hypothetical protein
MANPPPPFANIAGITRTIMKDNQEETIANYDGNARPGEIVINLNNNDVYIGNTNGNLNLLVIGGGSGNSEPAGPVGAIQYNSGGNLFGGTANVVVSGTGLVVTGNIQGDTFKTGNIIPTADNTYFLGNSTNRWANLWLGPGTIYITDSANASNTAQLTVSNGILQVNGATGLQANLISGNTTLTLVQSGNITLNASGSTAELVVSNTGAAVTGNLAVSGISNLGSNANVKITGGSNGQSLTTDGAGNLSWTTVSAATPTYGQFWSNVTQTVALPQTEYLFSFNNSDLTSNVTLGTGASNSRIIINQTGIYNIQFSAQIDKNPVGSSTSSAYIWFKKNGTAIPASAGFSTIDNAIQDVLSWNILANVANVGDYYEIAYAATHTYVSFPALAGNVTVGYPETPSIIVTVTPV